MNTFFSLFLFLFRFFPLHADLRLCWSISQVSHLIPTVSGVYLFTFHTNTHAHAHAHTQCVCSSPFPIETIEIHFIELMNEWLVGVERDSNLSILTVCRKGVNSWNDLKVIVVARASYGGVWLVRDEFHFFPSFEYIFDVLYCQK